MDDDKSILVIDDSETILTIASNLLSPEFKSYPTVSKDIAFKILEKKPISLILMDVEMPDINGFDLLKLIREKGYNTPVVFLTGLSNDEISERLIRTDALGYISKPIVAAEFIDKIRQFLNMPRF